jgi:nitrite reductase/ring-hydroxylating ferredoxin subunit
MSDAAAGHRLCRLSALGDPGTKEAVIERDGEQVSVFVVRKDGQLTAFVNVCPHRGVPLNWQPDAFLHRDRDSIQCSLHGARFRIEDGLCFTGPCEGRSLKPIAVAVEGGYVVLTPDQDG